MSSKKLSHASHPTPGQSAFNYPPDLLKYAVTGHALDNVKIQTNIGWMPEGAFFVIGKEKLSKEAAEFFTRHHGAMFKILAFFVMSSRHGVSGS